MLLGKVGPSTGEGASFVRGFTGLDRLEKYRTALEIQYAAKNMQIVGDELHGDPTTREERLTATPHPIVRDHQKRILGATSDLQRPLRGDDGAGNRARSRG